MENLKVAVLGAGSLGQHHARVYHELPGADLCAVVDPDREQAEKIAGKYNTAAVTDFREIIEAVDAVSVVVPTVHHFTVAEECIEKNVHVMVEKPITTTVAEAQALIDLASEHKVVLQVGHIERFNSAIRELARRVKTPGYIEVERLSPFPFRSTDVSVVLDLMIHDIDIVRSLVDAPLVKIDAVGASVFTDVEDIANARLQFANGCIASISTSRVSVARTRKIRVYQPGAYFSVDYISQVLTCIRKKNIDFRKVNTYEELIEQEIIQAEKKEPLYQELESFIHCVRTGAAPVVSGRQGRDALQVTLDVIASIRR